VNLVGRLAAEPRQRRTGSPRTTLRLVVVRRRRAEGDAGDLYVDVVTYGALATTSADLHRGRLVAVTGRLEQRDAEPGDTRSPHFVVASEVDFLDASGPRP
jgi:single-stranded DNA-binding protein